MHVIDEMVGTIGKSLQHGKVPTSAYMCLYVYVCLCVCVQHCVLCAFVGVSCAYACALMYVVCVCDDVIV